MCLAAAGLSMDASTCDCLSVKPWPQCALMDILKAWAQQAHHCSLQSVWGIWLGGHPGHHAAFLPGRPLHVPALDAGHQLSSADQVPQVPCADFSERQLLKEC